jgi:hypothetical protein
VGRRWGGGKCSAWRNSAATAAYGARLRAPMGPADGGGGWGEGSRTKTEGTHVEVALTEKQR